MLNLDLLQDNPRRRFFYDDQGAKLDPFVSGICNRNICKFQVNPSINMKLMTRAKISPVEIGLTYIRAFVIKR